MMGVMVFEMSLDDYDEVRQLWESSRSIEISDIDSRESITRFLERNPGLSYVARDNGRLVGVVLCGHDGRRGYIDQLVVARSHRRKGVGRSLVSRCLFNLMRIGIRRWNLFVLEDNQEAIAFWTEIGWAERVKLVTMSREAE